MVNVFLVIDGKEIAEGLNFQTCSFISEL